VAEEKIMHEQVEVDARSVLWGAAAIAIGVILAVVAAYLLWRFWGAPSGDKSNSGPNAGDVPAVTAPVLQTAPQPERAQYFAEKRKQLESWGWVDQHAGVAHIPIEEAMRMMAAQQSGRQREKP
jgi:hypothetical protein